MAQSMTTALLILLIGMGFVFASIVLLWGVMAAIVRLAADRPQPEPEPQVETGPETGLRVRAAAAAVAVARQRAAGAIQARALPPTAFVSAWQAVMRGRQFRQRGNIR